MGLFGKSKECEQNLAKAEKATSVEDVEALIDAEFALGDMRSVSTTFIRILVKEIHDLKERLKKIGG